MGYNNQFLLRESLHDTGQPTTHSLYGSPDLIGHKQVEHPAEFFKENYDTDPNEKVDPGSQFNFLYGRVKNLASQGVNNQGYLHVYQCGSSLFMQPSLWKQYRLSTMEGNQYLSFSSSQTNEILAGSDPFRVSNKYNGKYCLVGIVTDQPEECIPSSDFGTYSDFTYWVRNNSGIALRNLNVEWAYKKRTYERSDILMGQPEGKKLCAIQLEGKNLPEGTELSIRCDALGVAASGVYDPNAPLATTCYVPSDLNTYVISSAVTPDGTWPNNASLTANLFFAVDQSDKCYVFGRSYKQMDMHTDELLMDEGPRVGRLVLAGRCESLFVS